MVVGGNSLTINRRIKTTTHITNDFSKPALLMGQGTLGDNNIIIIEEEGDQ